MAAVVREMVARGLDGDARHDARTRVTRFLSVRAGRSTQGRLPAISEKHDDALAAAYEK